MLLRDTVGRTLQPVTENVAPADFVCAWPPSGVRVAVFVSCFWVGRQGDGTVERYTGTTSAKDRMRLRC